MLLHVLMSCAGGRLVEPEALPRLQYSPLFFDVTCRKNHDMLQPCIHGLHAGYALRTAKQYAIIYLVFKAHAHCIVWTGNPIIIDISFIIQKYWQLLHILIKLMQFYIYFCSFPHVPSETTKSRKIGGISPFTQAMGGKSRPRISVSNAPSPVINKCNVKAKHSYCNEGE